MHFQEQTVGDFKIYAGAIEAAHGGYVAAVVVKQVHGGGAPCEVFRDESMCDGRCWTDPESALHYAMTAGRSVIRDRARLQSA
ncbi:hypothetical protein [Rhizobacter sp. SG703]|uniref:hypothetical protein n=1 Tax=Rhizobacter sp. SG703 TaxID=2587140 RepID=UPI0014479CC3|nr:hypothetical protein [Rhizobacter sp. SG703]NKI92540.1 hypothetical protein [Rhizobacter sp. SG703]